MNMFKTDKHLLWGVYGICKPRASPSVSKFHERLIGGVYPLRALHTGKLTYTLQQEVLYKPMATVYVR